MNTQHTPGPFDTEEGRIIADALTKYAASTIGRDRSIAEQLAITLPIVHSAGPEPLEAMVHALLGELAQIERLSREGEVSARMQYALGDIARAAIAKAAGSAA